MAKSVSICDGCGKFTPKKGEKPCSVLGRIIKVNKTLGVVAPIISCVGFEKKKM